MNNRLFDDVERYLIEDKRVNFKGLTFLEEKAGIYRNDVCNLLALQGKGISLKGDIIRMFLFNLYKFKEFNDLMNVVRKDISPIIQKVIGQHNLTKNEISAVCNNDMNKSKKSKLKQCFYPTCFCSLIKKTQNWVLETLPQALFRQDSQEECILDIFKRYPTMPKLIP